MPPTTKNDINAFNDKYFLIEYLNTTRQNINHKDFIKDFSMKDFLNSSVSDFIHTPQKENIINYYLKDYFNLIYNEFVKGNDADKKEVFFNDKLFYKELNKYNYNWINKTFNPQTMTDNDIKYFYIQKKTEYEYKIKNQLNKYNCMKNKRGDIVANRKTLMKDIDNKYYKYKNNMEYEFKNILCNNQGMETTKAKRQFMTEEKTFFLYDYFKKIEYYELVYKLNKMSVEDIDITIQDFLISDYYIRDLKIRYKNFIDYLFCGTNRNTAIEKLLKQYNLTDINEYNNRLYRRQIRRIKNIGLDDEKDLTNDYIFLNKDIIKYGLIYQTKQYRKNYLHNDIINYKIIKNRKNLNTEIIKKYGFKKIAFDFTLNITYTALNNILNIEKNKDCCICYTPYDNNNYYNCSLCSSKICVICYNQCSSTFTTDYNEPEYNTTETHNINFKSKCVVCMSNNSVSLRRTTPPKMIINFTEQEDTDTDTDDDTDEEHDIDINNLNVDMTAQLKEALKDAYFTYIKNIAISRLENLCYFNYYYLKDYLRHGITEEIFKELAERENQDIIKICFTRNGLKELVEYYLNHYEFEELINEDLQELKEDFYFDHIKDELENYDDLKDLTDILDQPNTTQEEFIKMLTNDDSDNLSEFNIYEYIKNDMSNDLYNEIEENI